jgi:hypothetical protein
MIKIIGIAGFALMLATAAQAMTPAPLAAQGGPVAQVAFRCGPGMTLVRGVCVPRSTVRRARRAVRRCRRWNGGVCVRWF